MAGWDRNTPWCFMLLLAAAGCQVVRYPDPVCAVKGSTVTLPCSFTPLTVFDSTGEVQIQRVIWCLNRESCRGSTPSVYDSESENNDPRFRYLGDKSSNCTLQITDLQKEDQGTLRFGAEFSNNIVRVTDLQGVTVTVSDGVQMEINSSATDTDMREGAAVTLLCSAVCPFPQMELTWFRDGHALSETGPALQLGPLTAEHSGNYSCGLKGNVLTVSRPYSLQVEAAQEVNTDTQGSSECEPASTQLAVRLVLFALHTVLVITAAAVVIKRTCVCKKAAES